MKNKQTINRKRKRVEEQKTSKQNGDSNLDTKNRKHQSQPVMDNFSFKIPPIPFHYLFIQNQKINNKKLIKGHCHFPFAGFKVSFT